MLLHSGCAFLLKKTLPYPTGLVFPLAVEEEMSFPGAARERLVLDGELLFFSTGDGYLWAVDWKNREVKWNYSAGKIPLGPPFAEERKVIVADFEGTIFCFNREGALLWSTELKDKISSRLGVFPRDEVFAGTESGKVFILESSSGRLLRQKDGGSTIRTNFVQWGTDIIFGNDKGHLCLIDESGKILSLFQADGAIQASITVSGDVCYFSTENHFFYSYNLRKRKVQWKVELGGTARIPPLFRGKQMFVILWSGVIYSLHKNNGIILWWQPLPSRSYFEPVLLEEQVVVSSLSSQVVAFKINTGEKSGSFESTMTIRSNPVWLQNQLAVLAYNRGEGESRLLFLEKEVAVSLLTSVSSPQKVNQEVILTVSEAGFFQPEFEFYLKKNGEIEILQEWSEKKTFSWFPAKTGSYVLGVRARDQKENAQAELAFEIEEEEEEKIEKKEKDKEQIQLAWIIHKKERRKLMNREEALKLVKKNLKNKNLVKHSLAVEACMKAVARHLGEDEEKWGLAGLLHDLDYEVTEKDPERHSLETVKILEEYDLPEEIPQAIKAHAGCIPCKSKMDWSIFAIDPLTGLIIAATLMHPSKKLKEVDLDFIKRRYKEKSFARGAKREEIEQIRIIGLELDQFISICLEAMQEIDKELGLY